MTRPLLFDWRCLSFDSYLFWSHSCGLCNSTLLQPHVDLVDVINMTILQYSSHLHETLPMFRLGQSVCPHDLGWAILDPDVSVLYALGAVGSGGTTLQLSFLEALV